MIRKGKGKVKKAKESQSVKLSAAADPEGSGKTVFSDFELEEPENLVSILSNKHREFFNEIEKKEALKRNPNLKTTKRKIKFSPVVKFIELESLDSERKFAKLIENYYIGLDFKVEHVFCRNIKLPYDDLRRKKFAVQFWNKALKGKKEKLEKIRSNVKKEDVIQDLECFVAVTERNWDFGGNLDEADADEQKEIDCCFPNGDRTAVDFENRDLFSQILDVVLEEEDSDATHEDLLCEAFGHYSVLQLMLSSMKDTKFSEKSRFILANRLLHPESEFFDFAVGELHLLRLFDLFEKEAKRFEEMDEISLTRLKGIEKKKLLAKPKRIFLKFDRKKLLEKERGGTIDTDDEDESNIFIFERQKYKKNEHEYIDLVTQKIMLLEERVVLRQYAAQPAEEISMMFDLEEQVYLDDPCVIVPFNWIEVNVLGFLLYPVNCLLTAKITFLRRYFDLLNQAMMLACLNNNLPMLNLVRKNRIPEVFKSNLLANSTPAETSSLGTSQYAVFNNKNQRLRVTKANKGKTVSTSKDRTYLAVNSSSFFINALVRADLYYSYNQNCLKSMPCEGHSGLLLLTMLRLQHFNIARELVREGVRVNAHCCTLPSKGFRWAVIPEKQPKGNPVKMRTHSEQVEQEQNSLSSALLTSIQQTSSKNDKTTSMLTKKLSNYNSRYGFEDDKKIRLLTRSRMTTPFAGAIEMSCFTSEVSTVDYFIKKGGRVARANYCAIYSLIPVLRRIAKLYFVREKQQSKKELRVSLKKRSSIADMLKLKSGDTMTTSNAYVTSIIDKLLLGLELPSWMVSVLFETQDMSLRANIELLAAVTSRASEEFHERCVRKKLNAKKQAKEFFTMRSTYRFVWLHWSLISEEWRVARFLVRESPKIKRKIGKRFDSLTINSIMSTVGLLILNLTEGGHPYKDRALNAFAFMLTEMNLMFSVKIFTSLFKALLTGVLAMELPPPNIFKALKRLFGADQIQFVLGMKDEKFKSAKLFEGLVLEDLWSEQDFEKQQQTFLMQRRLLSHRLYVLGLTEIALKLMKNEFWKDPLYCRQMIAGNFSCFNSPIFINLSKVCTLMKENKVNFSSHATALLMSSIKSPASCLEFLRNGFLNDGNISKFLFKFFLECDLFQSPPQLPFVMDISPLYILLFLSEHLKNNVTDSRRSEIYTDMMIKLKGKKFWANGLNNLFVHGGVNVETNFRRDMELHVLDESTSVFKFDVKSQTFQTVPIHKKDTINLDAPATQTLPGLIENDLEISEML